VSSFADQLRVTADINAMAAGRERARQRLLRARKLRRAVCRQGPLVVACAEDGVRKAENHAREWNLDPATVTL
jgi:hypothetical protein